MTSAIDFNDAVIIEYMTVRIKMDHARYSEVAFYLTSPSGTTHQLTNFYHAINTNFGGGGFRFGVNGFYGENSVGTWTLRMVDKDATNDGTLREWRMKVFWAALCKLIRCITSRTVALS